VKQYIILLILFTISTLNAQQEDFMTVTGDSLVGRMVGGESIREVFGNVVLKQGDVVITCQRAVQYLSRNDAELIGNVVVRQDSLTIETPHAFYLGNRRIAQSTSGVRLNDMKVILTADEGDYYFNEDRADFRNNVHLFDTVSTLTSEELVYFKNEDRMIAVRNVTVLDPENIIKADSLEYLRLDRITYATDNVSIRNLVNNIVIYGDHLEDYAQQFYTIIDRNPLLIQIDTSYVRVDTLEAGDPDYVQMRLDTLIISSLVMESFRDTLNTFYARDSVQIWRGNFASRNNYTVYHRNIDLITTRKVPYTTVKPALWFEDSQLTGDSINIYIRENRVRLLEVFNNSFLLSESPDFRGRYDQVSGERIFIHFEDGVIDKTEVFGNVLSIYFMYEEDVTNGLTKSSASSGLIVFEESKVSEVHLYGSPASEYYPENQVTGKELSFTLPQFTLYINRPVKESIIAGRRNLIEIYQE
jgi:lipopolysaccharide export system protein LptA